MSGHRDPFQMGVYLDGEQIDVMESYEREPAAAQRDIEDTACEEYGPDAQCKRLRRKGGTGV